MRLNRLSLALSGILLAALVPARAHGQSTHPCTVEIDARIAEVDAILAQLRNGGEPAQAEPRLRRHRAALIGLRSGPPCAGPAMVTHSGPITADWYTTAMDFRGQPGTYVFQCPPHGEGDNYGGAWGTDIYTDDSSVCVAAVHAGVITLAQGGRISVEIAPGRDSYVGTVRNGIVTLAYPAWEGSFIVRGPAPES